MSEKMMKAKTTGIPLFVKVVSVIQILICAYAIVYYATITEEKVFKANLEACEYRQDKYENGFSSWYYEQFFKFYNYYCEVQDFLTTDSPACRCNVFYDNGKDGPTIKKYPFITDLK